MLEGIIDTYDNSVHLRKHTEYPETLALDGSHVLVITPLDDQYIALNEAYLAAHQQEKPKHPSYIVVGLDQ